MERKHIVVVDDDDDPASDSAIVFGGWRSRAREKQLRLGLGLCRWHCWPFAFLLFPPRLASPIFGAAYDDDDIDKT